MNVIVNCSCGDPAVSMDYGYFETYPLRAGETLASIASASGINGSVIQKYNPGANFTSGMGIVFIPRKSKIIIIIF